MKPSMTILVPLHNSKPFIEVVRRNILELSDDVRMIISDPFENDETLTVLRTEFAHRQHVLFMGRRDIQPGWIPHYNDLLSRVKTKFFMWLAHDDEIDCSYLSICLGHLSNDPKLAGAVGDIEAVQGEGFLDSVQPEFPDSTTLANYQFFANALLFEWNLGVLFRAVFRTKKVRPINESFHQDHWADIIWAYGLCLENRVMQDATAIYRKRFFVGSAHSKWQHHLYLSASLPYLAQQIDSSHLRRSERISSRAELLSGISRSLIGQIS